MTGKAGLTVVERHFPKGHQLIRQGDPGDRAWLIQSGTLEVRLIGADGQQTVLATLGRGSIVGEMALVDPAPRSASVWTLSDVSAAEIDRSGFERMIAVSEPLTRYLLESFVADLRRAYGLPQPEWRSGGAEIRSSRSHTHILKRTVFQPGYQFFQQGAPTGDTAFLIQLGRVSIKRDGQESARLGPGRVFGKTSLVLGSRRLASAEAADQVICEIILKRDFDNIIASMPSILRALVKIYAERLAPGALGLKRPGT